ncbi:MAG: dTDP-4-dehydrorhamnose 3,5-epimerase [Actinomycetota bacterium]
MIIEPTTIDGLHTVAPERHGDERGFFARTWCVDEFAEAGLSPEFVQASVSYNAKANTLRGMHFQREPYGETKLIACIAGAVTDVLLDLRPDSPTYLTWERFELTAENGLQVLAPAGLAHGFQTLVDESVVSYHIDTFYQPDHSAGVRWDDPAFGIEWPEAAARILSDKDRAWPDYEGPEAP